MQILHLADLWGQHHKVVNTYYAGPFICSAVLQLADVALDPSYNANVILSST